ncbi:tetratricopeptide repeat-containing sulfotransferase family protein [Alkalimonas sp.]|uniref:tetratricopeptide repeat-containing sulfotransferase family protein n=1 Tax=Alkalimonas sp. TaxID=1872453 RepID=UPI00263B93B0|nr:tetratricopeptide repeat-containing sulfotransferase family protein [Alkalimonas sp.]MCC5827564.1 sulfotransferase [Alkalimonas sp.]
MPLFDQKLEQKPDQKSDIHPSLKPFWQALQQQDLARAKSLLQQLLQAFPEHSLCWLAASHFAEQSQQAVKALEFARRAQALAPETFSVRLRLLECLLLCQQSAAAQTLASELISSAPDEALTLSRLALQLSQLQQYDTAARLYQRALQLQPDNATLHFNYATMLRICGELAQAEQHVLSALQLAPGDAEAWHFLAGLRKQTPDSNHASAIRAQLARPDLSPKDQVQLYYALAKTLEDLQHYQASFQALSQGARIRRQHLHYQLEQDLAVMDAIADTFDASLMQQAAPGCASAEPIFILGLPRAGSTLLERFLGCSPQVQLAGELNNFAQCLQQAIRQLHPARPAMEKMDKVAMVRQSAGVNWQQLGQAYLDSTRPLTGQKPHFVDKLPLNFLYLGLIALALPKAKIIHIQRDPMDHAYAIYKHLFANAYPFSYDLTELGRYMQGYQQLMQHWQQLLPGRIHQVQYEQLVRQPEQVVPALFTFCELPWQDDYLNFHQLNQQASATGSASQIRQPVYQSSLQRWRHFSNELAPLRPWLQTDSTTD